MAFSIAARVSAGVVAGCTSSFVSTAKSSNVSWWKRTLRRVLHELDRCVMANVDTDELHSLIIASGLFAADESLKTADFWPGFPSDYTAVFS